MNLYIFINDRSNLDEVVTIIPVGHRENPTDKAIRVTLREELEQRVARYGYYSGRRDVVLLNVVGGSRGSFTLEVAEFGGYTGDLWLLNLLTDEQLVQLDRIADRMRLNAEEFPPAWALINRS